VHVVDGERGRVVHGEVDPLLVAGGIVDQGAERHGPDVGLPVRLDPGLGVGEPHRGRVHAGPGERAPGQPPGQSRVVERLLQVEHLERGPRAHPLGVGAALEGEPFLVGEPPLELQEVGRDLGDVRSLGLGDALEL
jgi:hypothetical protein